MAFDFDNGGFHELLVDPADRVVRGHRHLHTMRQSSRPAKDLNARGLGDDRDNLRIENAQ
jgi:hypothetical protein